MHPELDEEGLPNRERGHLTGAGYDRNGDFEVEAGEYSLTQKSMWFEI